MSAKVQHMNFFLKMFFFFVKFTLNLTHYFDVLEFFMEHMMSSYFNLIIFKYECWIYNYIKKNLVFI